VIYNGLDTSRVAAVQGAARLENLKKLGLPEASVDRRFVVIVANMRHDVKDYPMFLRAARSVANSVPDAAFLLAGEGQLQQSFRELATELGIADRTFFLGRCEHIAELLSLADVCVLSSKAEGFSNSILEYMAAGKPVVVTDVGGAREVVIENETGYIVPSGADELMTERIVSLLHDPQKARAMGEKGRRVIQQKFSSEELVRNTEALYHRLLKERGQAHLPDPELMELNFNSPSKGLQ